MILTEYTHESVNRAADHFAARITVLELTIRIPRPMPFGIIIVYLNVGLKGGGQPAHQQVGGGQSSSHWSRAPAANSPPTRQTALPRST